MSRLKRAAEGTDPDRSRSRLHRGTSADALDESTNILVGRIDRLADLGEERHEAGQQNVCKRETLTAQILPAIGHLAVQPFDAILRHRFESGRSLRRRQDAALDEIVAFAEAVSVGQRLADIEIDAAGPHPALGLLFRRGTNQWPLWMLVFEIFADRGDLRQVASVVEFERRRLSVRVALEMRLLAIFAGAQVDLLRWNCDALLCHEG